jgi:hypothetical protein
VSDKERLARLALEYMWSVFESTAPLGYEEVTNGLADRILAAGWRPAQPSQAHQAVVTEAAKPRLDGLWAGHVKGPQPVPDDAHIEVMWPSGTTEGGLGRGFNWEGTPQKTGVYVPVAYRITAPLSAQQEELK